MNSSDRMLSRFAHLLLILALPAALAGCSRTPLVEPARDYDVRILRDTWGVPHIFGKTDADAAYGLAWAHAEDDFETIQGALFAARGRLGTLIGPQGAPNDYMVQLLRVWETIEAEYDAQISPDTQAVAQGYADGLNAWALEHRHRIHPDLLPVHGKEVIAGFVHKTPLFFGLDKALGEVMAEEPAHSVSERRPPSQSEHPAIGYRMRTTAAAGSAGEHETQAGEVAAGNYGVSLKSGERFFTNRRGAPLPVGSNMFSVAPSRSADGKTRLAVNSHQPWTGPVAWYEAHLVSEEGLDVVGGTFPGAPIILHGHNRNLGWAHTVNSPDLIDIYELTIDPDDEDRYLFDGQWREFEKSTARMKVKLLGPISWTVTRPVLWSVYGPAMRGPHGTYAIRYAGMGRIGAIEQWYRMNRAENFEEWMKAMRLQTLPMFNTGYADREGNIFYIYNALLPMRTEAYDWSQYLPGNTSETLWTDYLPFDELPMVKNPRAGFVINANGSPFFTTLPPENPNPANYAESFGIETYSWNREMRAMHLLGTDESITGEEFETYKWDMTYDARSRFAQIVRIVLEAPEPTDPLLKEAREVLAAWDHTATPDNTSAAIAIMTAYPLVPPTDESVMVRFEPDPEAVMASFEKAARTLEKYHGRIDVPWREVNRLVHGDTDLGVGGGPFLLHAVYGDPVAGRLIGRAGDSYVLLVEWGPEGVSSKAIHQFGSATLDESSPHYADQAELFVERRLRPVWLDEAEIREHLEREYQPGTIEAN